MTTESEAKLERYKAREREADSWGRVVGVRQLRPSEQTRLIGFCPDLTGITTAKDKDGKPVDISDRAPLFVAASVCEINEGNGVVHISFPRNREELDSIYDRLDTEGIVAALKALSRLNRASTDDSLNQDEAKNLSGTTASDSSVGS